MRSSTRDRAVLPILMPVAILVVIGGVLFGFSRILLSITHHAATATALIVAFGIVVVAGIVVTRAVVKPSSLVSMVGGVAGIAMLAGGIALIALAPSGPAEGGGGGPAVTVNLVAKGIAFQQTTLSAPAGAPFAIAFDNQDAGIQHDVVIYDNQDLSGDPVFEGDVVTGPGTATYEVPELDPATYYFHCSIHPQMQGRLDVAEAGGGGGGGGTSPTPSGSASGGGGGATTTTVTAQGLAFDTSTISLPAGQAVTLTFDNQDAGVQHNIAIFPSETELTNPLFRGDLVTGPVSSDYQVPALDAGTYYFHCDVHPTMNGSVVVG